MTVRLFLFGSPTVEVGGESLALPFERRHQMLVFLALRRSWVGRAELAALLWPEQENKLAYTNLRKILHRVQSLRWAAGLESQGGAIRFEAETDVFAFESALREQRIADALPMRRGELLAGFDDDQSEAWSSWLNFERDRLWLAWREAALNRLTVDIDTAEAIDLSTRLLKADPLDEAALRANMSWLARGGQSARAREAYRGFVARLAQDLRLAPGAELQALHDSLGTAVWSPTSAASTALAKFDDDFVGRTIELRRIGALLAQDDCRLLCLMGPGGVGKTRLAQRAMHEFAPRFSEGVAFIPLEDIASASELGGRLAREVGISGSGDSLEQVIEFLCERQMLLVLDNFEHLAAEASILDRLLTACTQLKVIVTSRVRLAISMEWLLPLEGLPCPELEDQDRVEAFDAARLFIKAARRVEPALVPSVEAASIIDICRQVEGLPLALQLAAAWTRVLPCDAIAAELRQGTELLRAVDAARPSRHASIEVVFDQSWRLLSAIERDALSRLSVFHGGFSADAARAVAAAPLPVLAALTDKSLLRKDGARLFMHPLVQQLASLRLGEQEVRAAAEQAHALYFQRLLGQLRNAVENGDREALQQVDTEFENCRIAWRWSIAHATSDVLTKSAPTLFYFCDHRSRFNEGVSLLSDALESQPARIDSKLEALLLSEIAHLEYRLDRYADAEAAAARALAEAKHTRDHHTQALCLQVIGACCLRLGRHVDARRFFKQALQHARAASAPRKVAVMLHNQALVERAVGRADDAQRLFTESLTRHKALGDVAGEALCLTNLSLLLGERGEFQAAVAHLKAGLVICEGHGFVHTQALILANLTDLAIQTGDSASVESYGRRAIEIAEAVGNRYIAAYVRLQFALLAVQRGDLIAARSDLEVSLRVAIAIGRQSLLLEAVSCFAEILAAQGESDCARLVLDFAVDQPATPPPARDKIRARLTQLPLAASIEPAWPGLEFDELVHRIVVESNIAHAPLIAILQGAH